jgi:hypothetical protein
LKIVGVGDLNARLRQSGRFEYKVKAITQMGNVYVQTLRLNNNKSQ